MLLRRIGIVSLSIPLFLTTLSRVGWALSSDVELQVNVSRDHAHIKSQKGASRDVVAWLVPLQPTPMPRVAKNQQYTLVQKDRQFIPHILVVPKGSSVDFPNQDTFFHNVFSLFNGKRFDLGLYEAHTHRAVTFDREGISFIFCNIHPQMGAVVLSLDTPYYGISGADGTILIHNIPAGNYRLNLWAENVSKESLASMSRIVEVKSEGVKISPISLQSSGDMMSEHTNKFGENYSPMHRDAY